MARGKTEFDMDASGAFGVMGSIDGFTAKIKTPVFIGSVLHYTHGRLSDFFDAYFEGLAHANPDQYMHVFEWPQQFRNYKQTVGTGNPMYRLWAHTITGRSSNATASFQFLPSTHPVPVDPILTKPGEKGRKVKTGVHVFVWKAPVFEYGLPVKIAPKLAQYLAYVFSGDKKGGGMDAASHGPHGRHLNKKGGDVMLSKGPVSLTSAGNGKLQKFTNHFRTFYRTMAMDHLKNDIYPDLERDLSKTIRFQLAQNAKSSVKSGLTRGKTLGIKGQASNNKRYWYEAKKDTEKALSKLEETYIVEAAKRRRTLYG